MSEDQTRAWPFQGVPEAGQRPRFNSPDDFVAARGEGIDAIVVRIGLNGAQLVLVDSEGFWDKFVYTSTHAAEAAAESLGLEFHTGEYPEGVRVRMNAYRRPKEDFDAAAYPEQGAVGPVIQYPENRPRDLQEPSVEKRPTTQA